MGSLAGKTLFITGASRGIGEAIAVRAARDGANVVIAAKTETPHPKLPGTIHTAAEAVRQAGGQALPVVMDVRFEEQVAAAVDEAVARFGGIDIVVNNASAIMLTDTASTPIKRFDLMHQVGPRGAFLVIQRCLPHLLAAPDPQILNLSPPLDMRPKWFGPHVAYTMAKYGMSMLVLGMAEEFQGRIAVNALWPRTAIATAAIRNVVGDPAMLKRCRTPAIVADAAHAILTAQGAEDGVAATGSFFVDEDVLRGIGETDFSRYAVDPTADLVVDFFLD